MQKTLSTNNYRWVILALIWLIYASFGLVARSISPLVSPIIDDLGISYSQMGFILGAWQLTYILAAMAAGTLVDKWGVKFSLLLGAVMIGLSAGLRFFASGFLTMLAAVAIFGLGGPMISIGGPKAISEWFDESDRGTAVGIYMTGPWIGGLTALAMTNTFVMPLSGQSWRLTFVIYGLLAFTAGVLWWFMGKNASLPKEKEQAGFTEVFGGLIKLRFMQVLLVMALCAFAIGHGFSNWLPKVLEAGGFSAAKAGLVAALPLAAGIPAVLLIPRFTPSKYRPRVITVFAAVLAVMIIIVFHSKGPVLIFSLLLMGIATSSTMPLMLLLIMDNKKIKGQYMGSAGGMFFTVAEVGGFIGPASLGVLVDITGTFSAGAFFLAALALSLSVLSFKIRKLI